MNQILFKESHYLFFILLIDIYLMTMIHSCLILVFFVFINSVISFDLFDDPSISHDILSIDVGKRIKMECELNSSMMNDNRKVIIFISLLFQILFYFMKTKRVYGYD